MSTISEAEKVELILRKRRWHQKFAKTITEQSLLSHAMTEYHSALRLTSIAEVFSKLESEILKFAALLHDIGKETSEWQECAIKSRHKKVKFPQHIAQLEVVKEALKDLEKDDESFVKAVWIVILLSHPGIGEPLTVGKVQSTLLSHPQYKNVRFDLLSDIANLLDWCASVNNPEEVIIAFTSDKFTRVWGSSPHGLGLHVTYHRVGKIRGVLTYLLHKAIEEVYTEEEFLPLLVYATGTVYIGKKNLDITNISKKIEEKIMDLFIEIAKNEKVLQNNINLMINRAMIGFDYLVSIRTIPTILDYAVNRLSSTATKSEETQKAIFLRLLSSLSERLRDNATKAEGVDSTTIEDIFNQTEQDVFGASFKEIGIPTKYNPFLLLYDEKLANRKSNLLGFDTEKLVNELPFSKILECFKRGFLLV
ncbi:MAG: HD domain-containing protein [Promethearchaeota archaeon]